jgi:peptide/nickel transport system permease protein
MGTDDLGRDVFSGVAAGARTSVIIAVSVIVLTVVLGVAVGVTAGYAGGALDDVFMRVTEIFQAVPRFFLAVVALAVYGTGVEKVVLVLGLTSWPILARVVRAETLSLRERQFIEAGRAAGASDFWIIRRHILPNAAPAIVVVALLTGASAILLEAGLGFLGLSDPQSISWGYLVNNSQRFFRVAWWMAVFPGAAIALAVLALNLLGDAINDALTPHRHS